MTETCAIPYAIADRLSVQGRVFAANLRYETEYLDPRPWFRRTRCAGGPACPLGVALYVDGLIVPRAGLPDLIVSRDDVAAALNPVTRSEYDRVATEAMTFIADWDCGEIVDLATSLGV